MQDYHQKIKDLDRDKNILMSYINKEAATRLISNSLSSNNKQNTSENNTNNPIKKVKNSVPVPESPHLNWQKKLDK